MDQKRAQHRATSSRKIVAVDPATNGRRPAAAGRAHPPRGPLLAAAGQGHPPAAKAPPLFPRTCRGRRGISVAHSSRGPGVKTAPDLRAPSPGPDAAAPPPPPPRPTSPRRQDPPGRTDLELRPWSLRLAAEGRWQGIPSAYACAAGLHGRRRRRPRGGGRRRRGPARRKPWGEGGRPAAAAELELQPGCRIESREKPRPPRHYLGCRRGPGGARRRPGTEEGAVEVGGRARWRSSADEGEERGRHGDQGCGRH
ncbi:hypothetical protein PVAP13_9NG477914 [Panicum virgatum]|uniref:Uncharacterized protein n=1 Tax=Panicum virgatum TaxID=38727 RepID=A0A8T0MQE3_PANVG|nr:hypothetical protein PVAP13_9NG477914 [Panicum virgatum]